MCEDQRAISRTAYRKVGAPAKGPARYKTMRMFARSSRVNCGIFAALLGCYACSDAPPGDVDGGLEGCTVHDQPSFELGTGVDRFETLQDDQLLRMAPG